MRTITADNQNFDFARLGPNRTPARPPFPQHGGNTSLQLKKVPLGVNTITLLNNHFSKFGKIINIQVSRIMITFFTGNKNTYNVHNENAAQP